MKTKTNHSQFSSANRQEEQPVTQMHKETGERFPGRKNRVEQITRGLKKTKEKGEGNHYQ